MVLEDRDIAETAPQMILVDLMNKRDDFPTTDYDDEDFMLGRKKQRKGGHHVVSMTDNIIDDDEIMHDDDNNNNILENPQLPKKGCNQQKILDSRSSDLLDKDHVDILRQSTAYKEATIKLSNTIVKGVLFRIREKRNLENVIQELVDASCEALNGLKDHQIHGLLRITIIGMFDKLCKSK